MKKITKILLSMILAVAICFGAVSGCSLVSKNTERDMKQVVATVQLEGAAKESIYKRDVIMMYINYGYQYVQSYGYTLEQAIQLIVDSLVTNKLLVQSACEYFYEKATTKPENKYDAASYLDEYEKALAEYQTLKAFNDLIESYIEEDVAEEETYTETARAVPTGALTEREKNILPKKYWEAYANAETPADKRAVELEYYNEYIAEGIVTGYEEGERDAERISAYNQTLDALKANSLLGDSFDYANDDITNSEYYLTNIKNNYESVLLALVQNEWRKEALANVTFQDVARNYTEMYQAQKTAYDKNEADYLTALGEIDNGTTQVVYNPYEGYGYVYNLLLGADEIITAEINEINSDAKLSKAEKLQKRSQALAKMVVVDQRSTWVTNNYDFNMADNTFGEDYGNYPFQGTVEQVAQDDPNTEDEDETKYEVTGLKEFDLQSFNEAFEQYVYTDLQLTLETKIVGNTAYRQTTLPQAKEKEFRERVNELIFAYSTDPGSLSSIKGYVSAPAVMLGETETYVQEFADAARELVEYGVGSYTAVETNYGIHIMICSEKINVGGWDNIVDYVVNELGEFENEQAMQDAFNRWLVTEVDDLTEEEQDTYFYKFFNAYLESYVSERVTNEQNKIVKQYMNDKQYVKVYKSAYADLK